jgi:FKBP-type peptidyl-prolyl cis-trans isomerase FkpA
MKRFLFAAVITGSIFAASCEGDNRYPGYEKVENGTYFLVHSKGSGTITADTGFLVFIKIKFKTEKDSVFIDINKANQNPSFPMRLTESKFKGDFLDMFMRLHAGDSASFFVNLDSLKANYPNQFDFPDPKIDSMQYLGFAVKVDSIYSRSQVAALQKKMEDEESRRMVLMQKRQAALGPLQKIAQEKEPELKKNDSKLLKAYLAANKFGAPDENGIYFREEASGTGEPLAPGMLVSVMYTGKYLDGSIFDSNKMVEGEDPLQFRLGEPGMIPGFANSVMKMKKGGKATFILPPKMGYQDSLTRIFRS